MPDDVPPTIRQDILTAHLQGEAVLLDLNTKRYYRLNATAARVWKALEARLPPARIVDALLADFDVDRATAEAELTRILADLGARGLLV